MSNYTKSTNFATKDTLPTGDAGKIVKGTEIDNEFNAISSAVASKADTASPTFTGTPAAPTATAGSNTTQLANTAYVKAEITTATGALGTMSTQNKTAVDITGGTIVGITDLAVADGGTGASSITANSVILGNGTSTLSGNLVAPGTSGNVLTSNGTTWASTAIPQTGLGVSQTWQSVSRSTGTTYTNSTGKPIAVWIGGSTVGGTFGGYVSVTIGSVSLHGSWAYSGSVPASMLAIVPVGETYSYSTSNVTSLTFYELR